MEAKEVKRSYLTGILGAILGGVIAAIPWVLTYVYGNMMLSLLALIIGAGEFYGYKLCKGKMTTKLPIIIMVIAIIIVTVVTLLVIPFMLLQKNGMEANIEGVKALYSYSEFTSALMRDYAISVVFTILGAGAVTGTIKKQLLNNSEDIKLDFSNKEEQQKLKEDSITAIKPIFEKYNAMNKENTMTKEEVLAEIEGQSGRIYFSFLKNSNIIKKSKGKYFYCEENEEKVQKNKTNIFVWIFVVLLLITASSIMINNEDKASNIVENADVSYVLPVGWELYQNYNENEGWVYYKNISNSTKTENETAENTIDYSVYPATLNVVYAKAEEGQEGNLEELKTGLDSYIREKLGITEFNIEQAKTNKDYDVLKVKIIDTSEVESIIYLNYIYNAGNVTAITAVTYNLNDEEVLDQDISTVVNTFSWK